MAKDINLLPDVTLKEERESKRQKLLTIISMAIFSVGVVALLAVYTLYVTANNENQDIKAKNEDLKNDILTYAKDEIRLRRIKTKLSASSYVVSNSRDYKSVIEDLQALVPEGITIADITMDKTNKVTVNGQANNSESFKTYHDNLLNPEKGGKRFTEIALGNLATQKDGTMQFLLSMNLVTAEAKQ